MIFEVTNYMVDCDKCGAILESYGTKAFSDNDEAKETAYWEGWEVKDNGECYCPECVKLLKNGIDKESL